MVAGFHITVDRHIGTGVYIERSSADGGDTGIGDHISVDGYIGFPVCGSNTVLIGNHIISDFHGGSDCQNSIAAGCRSAFVGIQDHILLYRDRGTGRDTVTGNHSIAAAIGFFDIIYGNICTVSGKNRRCSRLCRDIAVYHHVHCADDSKRCRGIQPCVGVAGDIGIDDNIRLLGFRRSVAF